jgi:Gly-Xaa carboxypeptidase
MAKNLEKQPPALAQRPSRPITSTPFVGVGLFLLGFCFYFRDHFTVVQLPQWDLETTKQCPQVAPLFPSKNSKELDDMQTFLDGDWFKSVSIERLSGHGQDRKRPAME